MTKAQILERCRNGERLCKTLHLKRTGETEITYCLETSGAHVSRCQAEALLRSGLFMPAGDGFFTSEFSQTWILNSAKRV